ncbi:MAG: DUF4143 domain-containing protein [Firmicutes bacterium]|nr:DUF4143 domain-containing protein [Bacillota bacterium]
MPKNRTRNGHNLYYWESKGKTEVDFVLQVGEDVIPIEVKAGIRTKSKSLSFFKEKYNLKYSIRISAKNFGFENEIKSVPLYAVFCIRLLSQLQKHCFFRRFTIQIFDF